MDPRRLVILGIVVAISIAIGVLARWQTNEPALAPAPGVSPPISSPSSPAAPKPAGQSALPAPSFDIARVEPNGEALVAGRAAPGSEVELLANGGVVDHTKANAAGEFVISPPPLAPGNHELTLRSEGAVSTKSVTVAVPDPGKGDVLVVVGEAGKPSDIVAAGPPASPAAPAVGLMSPQAENARPAPSPLANELRVAAVEAENGHLFVQGVGPAGARVIIYLNNQPLAEAKIDPNGHWSLTIERGLDAGEYAVRADQVAPDGAVAARAEVRFTSGAVSVAEAPSAAVPEAQAEVSARPSETAGKTAIDGAPPDLAAAPPPSANPVVKALETLKVQRGDNLWRISRKTYGRGIRYSTIYQANTTQIRNPNRIYPGQIFVMPPRT